MQINQTIRIHNWNINLEFDVITDKNVMCKFSDVKKHISDKRPDLVKKYLIKSKLEKGAKIVRIIAWDSLITELIECNLFKHIINEIQHSKY